MHRHHHPKTIDMRWATWGWAPGVFAALWGLKLMAAFGYDPDSGNPPALLYAGLAFELLLSVVNGTAVEVSPRPQCPTRTCRTDLIKDLIKDLGQDPCASLGDAAVHGPGTPSCIPPPLSQLLQSLPGSRGGLRGGLRHVDQS